MTSTMHRLRGHRLRRLRVRMVSVPPCGIASTALNTRFTSASRIWLSTRGDARQRGVLFELQVDDGAALLRHVAPARPRQVDHLFDQQVEIHRRQRGVAAHAPR